MVNITQHSGKSNYVTRAILPGQKSQLTVAQGDNVVFDRGTSSISRLEREAMDCRLYFEDGSELVLIDLFRSEKSHVESILTFLDDLYTATELDVAFDAHDNQAINSEDLKKDYHHRQSLHKLNINGKLTGNKQLRAVEDKPFLYHFGLSEDFPNKVAVKVLVNDKAMPSWLTLKEVKHHEYVLTGTPGTADVGQLKIDILVEKAEV